ncbi:hypothetical protein HK097_000984 [Rhizophlyctis rosea]|uniref:Uncharacterized protein n=1 Tax=Rhizophlyctis rosea TaxID=64517 RepID=A0AAD5X4I3_9FUNG|nr:hypothetical protein HK097_000984 [Rhizophlyctis rosea]
MAIRVQIESPGICDADNNIDAEKEAAVVVMETLPNRKDVHLFSDPESMALFYKRTCFCRTASGRDNYTALRDNPNSVLYLHFVKGHQKNAHPTYWNDVADGLAGEAVVDALKAAEAPLIVQGYKEVARRGNTSTKKQKYN